MFLPADHSHGCLDHPHGHVIQYLLSMHSLSVIDSKSDCLIEIQVLLKLNVYI